MVADPGGRGNAQDSISVFVTRLGDGDDVKAEIERAARELDIRAGTVLAGIGGLSTCRIRLPVITTQARYINPGVVEVVSIQGTVSVAGCHLHIAVSDRDGQVWGGHLSSGCVVRLSCEIVIGRLTGWRFTREFDPTTGFEELVVHSNQSH